MLEQLALDQAAAGGEAVRQAVEQQHGAQHQGEVVGDAADARRGEHGGEVVVITAGLARKPGMSRDDLLAANATIVRAVLLSEPSFVAIS